MALCQQHTFQILTKRGARMRAYMADVEREAMWMDAVAKLLDENEQLTDRCYPILGRRDPWLPLPNVWLGVSAEDQPAWDERVADLCATPAAVRFVSVEPMLGAIDAMKYLCPPFSRCQNDGSPAVAKIARAAAKRMGGGYVDQIIVGGESGPGARPMHPDWARGLRDQCAAAGVPFFFKQWGEWAGGAKTASDQARGASQFRKGSYHDFGVA